MQEGEEDHDTELMVQEIDNRTKTALRETNLWNLRQIHNILMAWFVYLLLHCHLMLVITKLMQFSISAIAINVDG